MKVMLEIPDEEIKEQLKESKYIMEGEGEKGSVDVAMLYTNGTLDFICVEGKKHFVKLKYNILPDNATNGDMIKAMFNCMVIDITNGKVYVEKIYFPFNKNWWYAPYKKSEGE